MTVRVILLLLAIATLVGCHHHDFDNSPVRRSVTIDILFDWSDDPSASPKEMTVYFFREGAPSSASPYIFDLKGCEGGRVTLPAGTYSAICHNGDNDTHGYVGRNSYRDFGLRLSDLDQLDGLSLSPSTLPRTEGAEEERKAFTPGYIWISALPAVEISESDTPGAVTFRMIPAVCKYKFIIHNPVNIESTRSIMATVSGMAGTLHPGRGLTGDESVTHLFNMTSGESGELTGEMLTFGHCTGRPVVSRRSGEDEVLHTLVVCATLANGRKWYSSHDVSSQFHAQSDMGITDIVVELDSLPIPQSSSGGGFRPEVGGWGGGSHESIGM